MTLEFLPARVRRWMDKWWYGEPAAEDTVAVLDTVSTALWLAGLTPAQLLATHQHQRDGRQTTPNDCAVVSMAMVIHQALLLAGYHRVHVPYPDLARAMDLAPFFGLGFYRVPFVGAVPPGRAAAALRCLARAFVAHGYPRPWRVKVQGRLRLADLVERLRLGHPTILYGVWPDGMPHAVVLAGYDPLTDQWYLLDPGYPLPYRPQPMFARWPTATLLDWWGRRYFAYQRYTAVWLSDIPRPHLVAEAEPVPQPLPLAPAA